MKRNLVLFGVVAAQIGVWASVETAGQGRSLIAPPDRVGTVSDTNDSGAPNDLSGQFITATARNVATGDTSEFSAALPVP